MIEETKNAFDTILSSLYQSDLMDADADMKVYDSMLKADGYDTSSEFGKGGQEIEK